MKRLCLVSSLLMHDPWPSCGASLWCSCAVTLVAVVRSYCAGLGCRGSTSKRMKMKIRPSRIHLHDSSCHKLLLSCTADAVAARCQTSNANGYECVAATEVD